MQRAFLVVAAVSVVMGTACSSSTSHPCGEGGTRFTGETGAVCAYAVVEGGFTCPAALPISFEGASGGRVCAPAGTDASELPPEACRHVGHDDCSGVQRGDPGGDPRLEDAAVVADGQAPPDAAQPPDAGSSPEGGARACDMLEATGWRGVSPFGTLDAEARRFRAADCGTISQAELTLRTQGGDELWLGFSFPVDSSPDGRVVEGTFEREANVEWRPADGSTEVTTAMVRVTVTVWAEHPDDPAGHEIDTTVTFLDGRFGGDPIVVRGRFCDWDFLTC